MARSSKKTSLRPIIFDTDVLIEHFRGRSPASQLLASVEHSQRWISSLTLMELLQGGRSRAELSEIQAFVAENISRIIHPRTSISEKAIHLIDQFALSHGLRVIDAMLAASALLHRAELATGNDRHFRFVPGLKIRRFIR